MAQTSFLKKPESLFFDWGKTKKPKKGVELNDETLRDGLQATYVQQLTLEEKKQFLHLLEKNHIHSVNIGFPASSPLQKREVLKLAKYIKDNKLKLEMDCGARALIRDIDPVLQIIQKVECSIEIGIFIGSSKIRQVVEKWEIKEMGKLISTAVSYARKHDAEVMFITEDTTRAHPNTVKYLYEKAIESGAKRICVCDTVGTATPESVKNLIRFIFRDVVKKQKIKVDWHGHNDRGLAVANSLAAADAGVDRIQATAMGVGERAGNTPMEELMVNLWLGKYINSSLGEIKNYVRFASQKLKIKVRPHDPIIGKEIFSTATGVHAAAINKAYEMGRVDLAEIVYSAISPSEIGRKLNIKVGPMSGKANVVWVLRQFGISTVKEEDALFILEEVKKQNRVFASGEIKKMLDRKKQ